MGFQILQWILSFSIWSIPYISLVKWIVPIMTSKWISNPSEKISKCWTGQARKSNNLFKGKVYKRKVWIIKKKKERGKKKTNDIRKVEEELGKNNMKGIEKRSIIIVILIFISSVCYNSLPLYIINEKLEMSFQIDQRGRIKMPLYTLTFFQLGKLKLLLMIHWFEFFPST